MKKFRKLFLVLILPVIFSGCLFRNKAIESTAADDQNEEKISGRQQEKSYEESLPKILQLFFENQNHLGLKEKILELRAPAKYLDLHFNLVVAFELIEQGKAENDQKKVDSGINKIRDLEKKYPWLDQNNN
ncbi:MAG TPA: hypothetical protein VJG65_01535 [Patescibacteria group bacterium]|nr:hypothetical protein [Patescibacteria group bacterium]